MSKLKEIQDVLAHNVTRLREKFAPPDQRSMNKFAKYLRIGNNGLEAIEKGEGNPQLDTLVKIAARFGMEPWTLFIRDAMPGTRLRVMSEQDMQGALNRAFLGDELPTPQPVPPQHLATPKRVAHRGRKRKTAS